MFYVSVDVGLLCSVFVLGEKGKTLSPKWELWTDSQVYGRVGLLQSFVTKEVVWFGNLRVTSLLFADDVGFFKP